MKDRVIGGLLVLLGGAVAIALYGGRALARDGKSEESQPRTVQVSGSSLLYAKPDSATFLAGVTRSSQKLSDAKAQCDAEAAKIDAALRGQGVQAKDIQTVSYNVSPSVEYVKKKPYRIWVVQETYSVHVRDIQAVSKVLDAAVSAGATDVNSIQFGLDDFEALHSKARAAAVKAAQAKAEELAHEMGVPLGEVMTVSESSPAADYGTTFNVSGGVYLTNGEPQHQQSDIRGGQITATGHVDVTFSIR